MIELRDYLAANCPDSELPKEITEGDIIRDLKIHNTGGKRLDPSLVRSATVKIRCMARYAYADAMLEVRKTEEDADESIS